ncbi:MAG TPA: squalene/phytoene synthase family protein [Stellaceae bacterium]|jgi:phytoene synthase|nr:squalene/phytoene synthase family protein [Stellaceae bacterium]
MATIPGYVKAIGGKTPARDRRSARTDRLSPVAALVRRHDRDRFQTVLFAPAARREALFALYAFNHEIARVRERVSEPTLGRIRLEWWRETIAAGYEDGPVRRHDVVEALTDAIRAHGPTREHFDRLIDAREMDLAEQAPTSLAALEDYAEAVSGRLIYLALELLGVDDRGARQAGFHVGIAYGLAGLLRAMPYPARASRPLVPAEVAAAASRHLALARGLRPAVARAALPALLPAIVVERYLRRLRRAGCDPFDKTVTAPDPLQSWRFAAAALFNRF